MTRDEAKAIISDLIEWYTEDLGARLGMSMGKDEYMDALDALWHGPEGELISRADAIDAVDRIKSTDNWQGAVIALLSALPSAEPPTGELISRADAVKAVIAQRHRAELSDYNFDLGLAEDAIRHLPSAEAVQGEWIGYNADKEDWLRTDGTPIFLVCDKCNGTVINNGSAHWNYCPNCGARMKGGDD